MRRVFAFASAVAAGVVGNAIFDFVVHHPPATAAVEPQHAAAPPVAATVSLPPLPPQPEQSPANPAAAVAMVPAFPVAAALGKAVIAALPASPPPPAPAAAQAGPGPGSGGLY